MKKQWLLIMAFVFAVSFAAEKGAAQEAAPENKAEGENLIPAVPTDAVVPEEGQTAPAVPEKPAGEAKPDAQAPGMNGAAPQVPAEAAPAADAKPDVPAVAPAVEPEKKAEEKTEESKSGGSGGGAGASGASFGAVAVKDKDGKVSTYFFLSFMLEVSVSKIGVGFDVRLLWNDDGVKKDDWNDWQRAVNNMFRYVRYGHKGDDIYAMFGVIEGASLGNRFIIGGY